MLELKHITKVYEAGTTQVEALKGIDIAFRENEFVAILGQSGCGKTTLLNIIGGLDRYTSGDLIINGRSTKEYDDRDWDTYRNHSIGFVFQSYNLIPHQSVLANVELALTLSGVSGEERRARAVEALEKVGLGDQLDKAPNQMSGGQQQRAALARILVGQPEALLLDEPFSALDSFLREEVEAQLAALLAEFDRPALLVTHNRDEAYRLCPALAVLEKGRVLRSGPTRQVFADPQTLAAARLTGCKNILPCVRRAEHTVELAGWGRTLRVEKAVPEHCRFVGVRAHDLRRPLPGAENLVPVRPGQVSEDPFDWNLDCTSPAGGGHLWWKVSKGTLTEPCPPLPDMLEIPAAAIMPLIGTEEDLHQ